MVLESTRYLEGARKKRILGFIRTKRTCARSVGERAAVGILSNTYVLARDTQIGGYMAIDLVSLLIHIIINIIIISPALWLSGRLLVGGQKAKLTDASWIVVLGTVMGVVVGVVFRGFFASIIQLVLWLLLVKHFFDTGWGKALTIAVIAVVIFLLVGVVLGLIGIALIAVF
ncbi:MAG: hypothetical protein V1915_02325 [Candidatus Bathyarchaeota archaeon]